MLPACRMPQCVNTTLPAGASTKTSWTNTTATFVLSVHPPQLRIQAESFAQRKADKHCIIDYFPVATPHCGFSPEAHPWVAVQRATFLVDDCTAVVSMATRDHS